MRRGVVPLGGRATRRRWRRRENGGLARNKSFFQKTLEAARGAFWWGLGRGGDGSMRRRCGVAPRPEDPRPRIASGAGSNPFPQGEGAQRERGQAWHEREQSERGEACGHRGRAQQDGEQAQRGRDQTQEACEEPGNRGPMSVSCGTRRGGDRPLRLTWVKTEFRLRTPE